mmetsp:Transcript_9051/g.20439  ORF Transcript_9051/g.20439 Transcript_9051/m.20439 type:complete len:216 (+) Transcript_9051:667-1314(+)
MDSSTFGSSPLEVLLLVVSFPLLFLVVSFLDLLPAASASAAVAGEEDEFRDGALAPPPLASASDIDMLWSEAPPPASASAIIILLNISSNAFSALPLFPSSAAEAAPLPKSLTFNPVLPSSSVNCFIIPSNDAANSASSPAPKLSKGGIDGIASRLKGLGIVGGGGSGPNCGRGLAASASPRSRYSREYGTPVSMPCCRVAVAVIPSPSITARAA